MEIDFLQFNAYFFKNMSQNWKYLFKIKPLKICKIHNVMNLNIYFFTIVLTWLNFKSVPNYLQWLLHICLNFTVFCLSCHVHLFWYKCVLGSRNQFKFLIKISEAKAGWDKTRKQIEQTIEDSCTKPSQTLDCCILGVIWVVR